MIPLYQDVFTAHNGNCFQACIASIFEIPLNAVPHFCGNDNGNWASDSQKWLFEHYGLGILAAMPFECGDGSWAKLLFDRGVLHLIVGKSPRGDFWHCCVGKSGARVHDPFPGGAGVMAEERWEFFIMIDPADRRPPEWREGILSL